MTVPAVRQLVQQSLAVSTRTAYAKELGRFDQWLEGREVCDDVVAEYLSDLFHRGRAPQTAGFALAAIRFRWRLEHGGPPNWPRSRQTLAGFARVAAHRGRGQTRGIKWADADRIAQKAATDGLTGLRDAAVVSIMSDCLLRISEARDIDVEHIRQMPDGAVLWLPRSKTDQEARGATQFIGPPTLARILAWREAAGIHGGPLFRPVWRETVGPARLSTKTIVRIIQRRAGDVGLAGRISGHSLRVGSAQSLAGAGATLAEMKQEGRWKSERMPSHYAAGELATQRATARLRYGT